MEQRLPVMHNTMYCAFCTVRHEIEPIELNLFLFQEV